MSAGDFQREQAWDLLQQGLTAEAQVAALLSISWELRTANLLTAARLGEEIAGGPGEREETPALREEIRKSLDPEGWGA